MFIKMESMAGQAEGPKPLYMSTVSIPAGSVVSWTNTPIVAKKVWLCVSSSIVTNVNPDTLEAENGDFYWQSNDYGVTWTKQNSAFLSINGNTVSTTSYWSSVNSVYGSWIISE